MKNKTDSKKFKHEIGIGITTQNRGESFQNCYRNIKKYFPKNAKLVVVDDASDTPVREATFRFDNIAGIAVAKNKCLELLDDCQDIFLFDDDCWPQANNWWKPYIESKEPHLCYIFKDFATRPLHDCVEIYNSDELVAYTHARGCMLYLNHKCLDLVGGMDTRHKRWGREHISLSTRIYNANLTTFKFQDVPNSKLLIHSEDEYEAIASTVSISERRQYLAETIQLAKETETSRQYCEYKTEAAKNYNNVVICQYLITFPDDQRGIMWDADKSKLQPLIDSMNGQRLIILNDCFDDMVDGNVEWVRVKSTLTPYWQRWLSSYQWLRDNPEVERCFLVDSTDVEMLKNPFKEELDMTKIYVGDENTVLNNPWMKARHPHRTLLAFISANRYKPLLNCGVIGGNSELVASLIKDMYALRMELGPSVGSTEMGAFNYLCYTKYAHRIVAGRKVTTIFKNEEYNDISWWKHK